MDSHIAIQLKPMEAHIYILDQLVTRCMLTVCKTHIALAAHGMLCSIILTRYLAAITIKIEFLMLHLSGSTI